MNHTVPTFHGLHYSHTAHILITHAAHMKAQMDMLVKCCPYFSPSMTKYITSALVKTSKHILKDFLFLHDIHYYNSLRSIN